MTDATATEAGMLEATLVEVKKVIVGQDRAIERLIVCLLVGGHCLLEGVPGLATTLAAETLARVVGGSFHRIQFTPDLLPADVMGTRIYRASTETFDVVGEHTVRFIGAEEEVEKVGARLRDMMPWIKKNRLVDQSKN